MSQPIEAIVTGTERVLPETLASSERVVPLSLLDATTANFGLTQAIWLFERPQNVPWGFNLAQHLRESLRTTLSAYPQWCGQCKAINTLTGLAGEEAKDLPTHARRFRRLYAHFGTPDDPGVDFITATCRVTLDSLHPTSRTSKKPLWNRRETPLNSFSPTTTIHSTLQPNTPDEHGFLKPLLAIQFTQLSGGAFVLAAKSAHPMADIGSLVRLLRDWGTVSRAMLSNEPLPVLKPVFNPSLLDARAAGDINAEEPSPGIIQEALSLPMHRYDWWTKQSVEGCPWPTSIPDAFNSPDLEPAMQSVPMPWFEWDSAAPVSSYIIHLTRAQVDHLHKEAREDLAAPNARVSKHDAVLAHIWSCIARSRNQANDPEPVHCDLVIGTRPALGLGDDFIGSPGLMIDIAMAGSEVAAHGEDNDALQRIVGRIRSTIGNVNNKQALAAYLHGLAFEKAPQRLWQAFLGSRHILVTTWARAGIYEVDFGLGADVRYVDGVVPNLDGLVLVKEAPASGEEYLPDKPAWTDNGVDISVALRAEDMERLLRDPLLLPMV